MAGICEKNNRKSYSWEESEMERAVRLDELRNAGSTIFRIPVFFSHPSLHRLGANQTNFILRLFNEIKQELLFPRTPPYSEQYPETIITNIRRMVLSSYGMAAANLKGAETAFLQIEPAMAYQYGLSMLLVKEDGAIAEGIWEPGTAPFNIVTWYSDNITVNQFFDSPEWKEILKYWSAEVRSGYYIQTEPRYRYSCNALE